jgi:hypothetical protein
VAEWISRLIPMHEVWCEWVPPLGTDECMTFSDNPTLSDESINRGLDGIHMHRNSSLG